jgi:hypothetical protein
MTLSGQPRRRVPTTRARAEGHGNEREIRAGPLESWKPHPGAEGVARDRVAVGAAGRREQQLLGREALTLRLDTTSEGWGLSLGHQRGPQPGHQRGLLHGHGQFSLKSMRCLFLAMRLTTSAVHRFNCMDSAARARLTLVAGACRTSGRSGTGCRRLPRPTGWWLVADGSCRRGGIG